ncbi:MFS transporter [Bordetella petrii]|uniref:MFS transporter n=1 Tax=Bordetella petrii TaxID=94624 RepID=UPI00372E3E81
MIACSSDIPARLDRLPWSAWHWRVVIALGVAWVLDGLEVTLAGSLGGVLTQPGALGLSAAQVGATGSLYVAGAVAGALLFGRMADRLGRKRLFLATLGLYMAATLATACAPNYVFFAACRCLTGVGIGGEYAAINSAIDELIPARVRGRVNLAINGCFWIGAALGAGLSLPLLDPALVPAGLGWRLAFALGALLAIAILLVRRDVPESPRWLLAHGRQAEALAIVRGIEAQVQARRGPLPATAPALSTHAAGTPTLREAAAVLLRRYPGRSAVCLALMLAQAFFYNAIFFTYALVLTRFYSVPAQEVGWYVLPFALGNVLGPLALGPLFDRVGRRRMIALTYLLSGLGLAASALAFQAGWLDARSQAWCWSAVFFVASAAASSAYLTVSEVFPLEMRGLAISLFYAAGTGAGGFAGPALYGWLIGGGQRGALTLGYLLAAALMAGAGILAWRLAVDAERKPLEAVAPPLGPPR